MDLTKEVIYRGFTVNSETITDDITGGGDTGTGISGCVIDSADFSDVDVVQFTEKKSQDDGMDAGDVHFGMRRLRMAGTLYDLTRALLFDSLWTLRAAFNPVLAQREEPADKGYRPLYFSVPTNRVSDYPSGAIALKVYAMPRAFQHNINRDQSGGDDGDSLAIPWQATLIQKDPGIYGADPVTVDFTASTLVTSGVTGLNSTDTLTKVAHGLVAGDRITFYAKSGGSGITLGTAYYIISSGLTADAFKLSLTSGGSAIDLVTDVASASYVKSTTASGNWTNRGTYLSKFNALIVVGAGAGSIVATVGDSAFTVTVPASTGNRTIRIKGDKVITFDEGAEVLAMDAIAFSGDTTWPLMDTGETPYSVTFHGMGGVQAGSSMWFTEQYA